MAKREGLIRARKAAGLTQAEVAALLGIPRTLYCQIELGQRPLRVELAKPLTDLLELDLEGLLLSAPERRDARSKPKDDRRVAAGE